MTQNAPVLMTFKHKETVVISFNPIWPITLPANYQAIDYCYIKFYVNFMIILNKSLNCYILVCDMIFPNDFHVGLSKELPFHMVTVTGYLGQNLVTSIEVKE